MKRLRTVVVLALLTLAPAALLPAPPQPPVAAGDVAEAVGGGIWTTLTCATCLGSYVALVSLGWGSLSSLVFTVGDGVCIDACIATF